MQTDSVHKISQTCLEKKDIVHANVRATKHVLVYFNRAVGETLKHIPLIIGLIFEQLGEG